MNKNFFSQTRLKPLRQAWSTLKVFSHAAQCLHEAYRAEKELNQLKIEWAQETLAKLNVQLLVKGEPDLSPSILFVGNHISYLDIPILLATVPHLSFVAKREIALWPIFGLAAKKIDTVFVNREKTQSRLQARQSIKDALLGGRRIVVFPSGTTSLDESDPWRRGVFEIAEEGPFYIQPFRLHFRPLRKVAYINRDFLPLHLYHLSGQNEIAATIEFGPKVVVTDANKDCVYWQNWVRQS